MKSFGEKAIAFLVKLNRLTSTGKLDWDIRDAPKTLTRGTDNHISIFLYATYRGEHFGLFERRIQAYDGEHERFYWTGEIVLALLDYEDNVVYEIQEKTPALYDLFEAARRQASNFDDVIDNLLADDDDE